MSEQHPIDLLVLEAIEPWPPIRFSLRRLDGGVPRILFLLVTDAETGAMMWQLAPETAIHPTGEVVSASGPRRIERRVINEQASEDAARAISEFDDALAMLARAEGVFLQSFTYADVPPGMRESNAAQRLEKGRRYTISVVGDARGQTTFTA